MKISVTAEDIAAGVPSGAFRCEHCPIARAIARAVDRAPLAVLVGIDRARLHNDARGSDVWQVELPAVASEFIVDFDLGRPVKPFDFDLEIPDA